MKAKHEPCACGCGELADECMGGGHPLAAFTVTESPTHRATAANCAWGDLVGAPIGSGLVCTACPPLDDDDPAWLHRRLSAAYGRQAFLQNWRKRAEQAEAQLDRLRCRHGNLMACDFCSLDAKDDQ